MALIPAETRSTPGYSTGAAVLFGAVAVILTALAFQYVGGYAPCPLCLRQRYAYYLGIPLLFFALVLIAAQRPRTAALLFAVVAIAFLGNAALGLYQAGAEWKLWPGPDTCAGAQGISRNAGNLIDEVSRTTIIRCDEAAWRFLGLSFAGWNAILSFVLFLGALRAAVRAAR
jgi:disulfide bond formation protein DsbB